MEASRLLITCPIGGAPLFTENPRRTLLGNRASGIRGSRKLISASARSSEPQWPEKEPGLLIGAPALFSCVGSCVEKPLDSDKGTKVQEQEEQHEYQDGEHDEVVATHVNHALCAGVRSTAILILCLY